MLVAIEHAFDNDPAARPRPLMSLDVLIETPGGSDYTGADFAVWSRDAAFRSSEVMPLAGPSSAALAHK